MAKIIKKNLDSSPDETRKFEQGKADIATFSDVTIGRAEFEPGWSWEKCVAIDFTGMTAYTNNQ